MAGNTAIFGWPYPEGDDAPDVPARMLALANAIEATVDGIGDKVTAQEGAWTSYTPTWTGGSPSIGNGALTGAYRRVGKTVWVRINLTAGTTTNFGSGSWSFTLPASLTSRTVTGHSVWPLWTGASLVRDVSASNYITTVVPTVGSASTTIGSVPSLSSTSPMTWASTDHLTINILVEVA